MENAVDLGALSYRVVGSFGLVLAVLFVTAFLFKRVSQFPRRAVAGKQIRLLARQPVGPKHLLVMVEAADRLLLLGVSPEGICLLSPLGEARLSVQEDEKSKKVPVPEHAFKSILDTMTDMNA
jgi:flagellar biosynthetic protein FliO